MNELRNGFPSYSLPLTPLCFSRLPCQVQS